MAKQAGSPERKPRRVKRAAKAPGQSEKKPQTATQQPEAPAPEPQASAQLQQDQTTGRFLPGNTLGGRKKGSRDKLNSTFLADLQADWEEFGVAVLADVRKTRPHEYLKVVASLVPKELNVRTDPLDDIDDNELDAIILAARAALHSVEEGGSGEGETPRRKQARQLLS